MRTRILIPVERIADRVEAMADDIAKAVAPDTTAIIAMTGGFVFGADLLRALSRRACRFRCDIMQLQSYGGGLVSAGRPQITLVPQSPLVDADVLFIDDILDTGRSFKAALDHFAAQGARSVRTAVLLDKPSRRLEAVDADFIGFEIPDLFVIGYGLDLDRRYRELPDIHVVEGE
ncbi:MAG: hypoxanthine phosphoribosyltransferase [Alphaproteobacteria bacterium]|nr:hypoxanthine phosphoribosyltransferase [Alphaproteobacteria bacterium]